MFTIRLQPGYLEPVPAYQVSEGALLSMRLDQGKPNMRSWLRLNDEVTYEYEGLGASGLSYYVPKKFLKDLFAARTLYVAFVPAGWISEKVFVAEFQLTGLREAFDQNPECFVK